MMITTSRRVGLHIRLEDSLIAIAQKAIRLELPFFQCFFVMLAQNRIIRLTDQEVDQFLLLRSTYFSNLYVHGSYWINLSSLQHNGYGMLKKEIALAKTLMFTHMVLHPGTAKGASGNKKEGIDVLARSLNNLFKVENQITIVLENTAHGNLSVGSDITDFKILLERLDYPDRIAFCIDTSHAHAYGYDLATDHDIELFIALLDSYLGIERIALLHLNDTKEKRGSRIDRHCMIGEGKIGASLLRKFCTHPRLRHLPIIMELPAIEQECELNILKEVSLWYADQ